MLPITIIDKKLAFLKVCLGGLMVACVQESFAVSKCKVAPIVEAQTLHLRLMTELDQDTPHQLSTRQLQIPGTPPILEVTIGPATSRGFIALRNQLFFAPVRTRIFDIYGVIAKLIDETQMVGIQSSPLAVSILNDVFPGQLPSVQNDENIYGFAIPLSEPLHHAMVRLYPEMHAAALLYRDPSATSAAREILQPSWGTQLPLQQAETAEERPEDAIDEIVRRIQRWRIAHPGNFEPGEFLVAEGMNREVRARILRVGLVSWIAGSGPIAIPFGSVIQRQNGFLPFFSDSARPEDFRIIIPAPPNSEVGPIVFRSEHIFDFALNRRLRLLHQIQRGDLAAAGLTVAEQDAIFSRIQTLTRYRDRRRSSRGTE